MNLQLINCCAGTDPGLQTSRIFSIDAILQDLFDESLLLVVVLYPLAVSIGNNRCVLLFQRAARRRKRPWPRTAPRKKRRDLEAAMMRSLCRKHPQLLAERRKRTLLKVCGANFRVLLYSNIPGRF